MAGTVSDREREHFNGLARKYEALYCFDRPAALHKVERLSVEFARYLADAPAGAVTEIGAGTGFFTRHLAPLVAPRPYLATDISEEMLAVSKGSFGTEPPADLDWKVENCLKYSFPEGSISAVTGHGILHHLPLEESVKEMARVLKPGGRIAFYEPNILNPYVWAVKTIPAMRPEGDTPDESALSPFKIKRLLRDAGFTEIRVVPCEMTLNSTPASLLPIVEALSRIVSAIPGIRLFLGGSLKITAVRRGQEGQG